MKFPVFRFNLLALVLCLPLLLCTAQADDVVTGSDTTESINRILRQIEEMAGVLALNTTLDSQQTRSLLDDLSALHSEVKGLKHANELLLQLAQQAVRDNVSNPEAETPAAVEPNPISALEAVPEAPAETAPAEAIPVEADPAAPTEQLPQTDTPVTDAPNEAAPAVEPAPETQPEAAEVAAAIEIDPAQADMPAAAPALEPGTSAPDRIYDKWEPFLDFSLELSPEESQYNGWVKESSIDLRWGTDGEIILAIVNGYSATWTISESFVGSPKANVSTSTSGEITMQVRDEDGVREYSLRNGGLGPIFKRWILEAEVAGDPA
jgi:outer membrane biosynthesis protein TonB